MDFLSYLRQLNPADFDKYTPPKGIRLNAAQERQLVSTVKRLPQDRNMLLYFWRFIFDMDVKTIRRYAGIAHANGVIEAFRFACKRYLGMDKEISNLGLRPVFEALIPEYEILLVSNKKGVCWFRDFWVESEMVHSAVLEAGQRYEEDLSGAGKAGGK